MATIRLHQTTTATPEQFLARLGDFGPTGADSNIRGGRSGHTYTLTRRPDGTTSIDAVVVRKGKNLTGQARS